MPTYKFSEFKVEITNPIIDIQMNTIGDKALDKLVSVDVVLTVDNAKFDVRLTDMPYVETWDDSDLTTMVDNKLKEYES